jgi:hypothetical protein
VIDPAVDSLTPADDSTGVGVNANLVITFSEPVKKVSGYITIYRSDDDQVIENINVLTGPITGSGTKTITIYPTGTFASETGYYVRIDNTAFDDIAGNSYSGINNNTTWNFTTADIIPPSVLSLVPADDAVEVGINDDLIITLTTT